MYTVYIHYPPLQIDSETSHDINKRKNFKTHAEALQFIKEHTETTPFEHVVLSGRGGFASEFEEEGED